MSRCSKTFDWCCHGRPPLHLKRRGEMDRRTKMRRDMCSSLILIKKTLKHYTKTINEITTVKLMRTVLTQAINIDNHPQTNSETQAT